MKKIFRIFLCAFLIFTLLITFFPQKSEAADSRRRDLLGSGSDYTSILYDSANGLPTSEANAIVQGSDGFIWLGGYSGLIRYDGTSFKRYDSTSGISSVFSLFVDSAGRLWIGTNENGIACLENGELQVYGRVEGMKSYSIRAINEDANGNILIATTQGLSYVGTDMEIHMLDDPQINLEYIIELERNADGRVFGLTLDGDIFELKDLQVSSYYEHTNFGAHPLNSIYADPEDPTLLHAGTTGSEVLTLETEQDMHICKRQSTGPLRNINDLLLNNGLLWISATNGIGYFDEDSVYNDLSDVPMNNSVGNIMKDHEGNMWFTSTRQGVLKLVPDRFTNISKLAGLDSVVVNSTCVRNGLLYLATDEGLTILNCDTYKQTHNALTRLLSGVRIRCVKCDSKGNLWFCTHGDTGLVCYKTDGSIHCYNSEDGLDTTKVRTCLERSDGTMAAATGNGLYLLQNGRVTAHYDSSNGISTTEILSLAEDDRGRLYLGSDGDGIYVLEDKSISRLGLEDGLTSGVVMRIKRDDKRGLFWLITSNSIEYMDPESGSITAVSNFPYSNNYDIYFDCYDNAWILASNGIYIVKVEQLLQNESIDYQFYNVKSGLPYIATGNSRSHISENGQLYISGTTGVCMVDINADSTKNTSIDLTVPSVEVDGRSINLKPGETVLLPAGSRRLVINAYALTYGLSNPRVSYQLVGFDKSPTVVTKQEMQPIVYTNLDGGRYTFRLCVIHDNSSESSNEYSLTIIKEQSLYENPIFWVILIISIIAVTAFSITRHYHSQRQDLLDQQEADREFIEQIMHTIAKCVDLRDRMNVGHSFRVAYYTKMLATKLAPARGYNDQDIMQFYNIALLHDIGKIAIPDAILNKPERLNDEEYAIMKTHAQKGEELLSDVDIVQNLAFGAGYHHERLDGKGYPRGLKGAEIPEVARIVAVADTFDAMYSTRPYRKQLPLETVLEELRRIRGTQLDAEVVDALFELAEENKLDKELVDQWVKDVKAPKKAKEKISAEEDAELSPEEESARRNREFLNSLGFGKKE